MWFTWASVGRFFYCRSLFEMLHATHILCLASPTSAAVKQATYLARRLNATLHVGPQPLSGTEKATWAEDAGDLWAGGASFDVEGENEISVRRPEPLPDSPAAVLEYVADAGIDLVVTDTPPDRGPVPPLATSVTQTLLKQLDRPVFVVGQVERPTEIRDILVPIDFSGRALQAFKHAIAFARKYDATVQVLHVVDSLPYVALTPMDRLALGSTPLSERRGRRRIRAFLQKQDTADVSVHAHLAYGDVAEEVIRFVGREESDLLFLASHGSDSPSREPLGEEAERILGRVTCPVFMCPVFGRSLLACPSDSEMS